MGAHRSAAVARRYVRAVNDADADALMALFADDAVLHHPTGVYEGPTGIRQFYESLVFAGRAELVPARLLDGDGVAMLELTASSPLDGHANVVRTLDVFDVNDQGRITRLTVYYL